MSEPFWYDNLYILFQHVQDFFPSAEMTLVEKLNAIMRFAIYIGIILTLLTGNYLYLYIPVAIGLFTIFINKNQRDNMETFFGGYRIKENEYGKKCVLPTLDNPFMNFNQITSDRCRPAACKSYNNPEIKQEIENRFNYKLYRDVSDLYDKSNSQHQYYTAPVTQACSDQASFAKWLYGQGPVCKEQTDKCAPEYSPYFNQQVFTQYGVK